MPYSRVRSLAASAALTFLFGCDDGVTETELAADSADCSVFVETTGGFTEKGTLTQPSCNLLSFVAADGARTPLFQGASYSVSVSRERAAGEPQISHASVILSRPHALLQPGKDIQASVGLGLTDQRGYSSEPEACLADVAVQDCAQPGFIRSVISNVRCAQNLLHVSATLVSPSLSALRIAGDQGGPAPLTLARLAITTQCFERPTR